MILIYTHQLNARIRYVFNHFFKTYTENSIEITDVLEVFIAYNGPKLSYTNQKLVMSFSYNLTFIIRAGCSSNRY